MLGAGFVGGAGLGGDAFLGFGEFGSALAMAAAGFLGRASGDGLVVVGSGFVRLARDGVDDVGYACSVVRSFGVSVFQESGEVGCLVLCFEAFFSEILDFGFMENVDFSRGGGGGFRACGGVDAGATGGRGSFGELALQGEIVGGFGRLAGGLFFVAGEKLAHGLSAGKCDFTHVVRAVDGRRGSVFDAFGSAGFAGRDAGDVGFDVEARFARFDRFGGNGFRFVQLDFAGGGAEFLCGAGFVARFRGRGDGCQCVGSARCEG